MSPTRTRRIIQVASVALTVAGVFVFRANAEQWCPFGGVEALYTYLHEGNMVCSLGVSNFYMLGGVLLSALVLRRAFCGYLCPIGAISEWLHGLGRWLRLPAWRVTGRVDRALTLLKYPLLAWILFVTWRAGELLFRGYDPCYALLSRHGEDITMWAYVSAGALVAGSLVLMLPFCRWLCPMAAVLNPLSRFGLLRVRRDAAACRGCRRCSHACPMAIAVDQAREVTSARCVSCLSCVEACPDRARGALVWGPTARLGGAWSQAALVLILLAITGGAVAATYLAPIPSFVKVQGTPPETTAVLSLRMRELTCRGRANLLVGLLGRDDLYSLGGFEAGSESFFRLEAWPSPGVAEVHIHYDPRRTNEATIKQAITEPYYDLAGDRWWTSPFTIEGYDPLALPPVP